MGELGIHGVRRGRQPWTTKADSTHSPAPDLVKRRFVAERPNQLWVSDFTCVSTWEGFVYVAFIVDVYLRMVVRWRVSTTMTSKLVTDALEHAVWARKTQLTGLVAHSDSGNTRLWLTPKGSPRSGRCHRSARSVIATTMPWSRRSTPCTRPS